MGLVRYCISRLFLPLSFIEGKRILKPEWYAAVEIGYNNHSLQNNSQTQTELKKWVRELSILFKELPLQNRLLCGGLGVATLTDDFTQSQVWTHLATSGDKRILERQIEIAREKDYHLMRRISGKATKGSPVKYHLFRPITLEEALGENSQARRNIEFTKIDLKTNTLSQKFTPENHIRLHIHIPSSPGKIKSLSDWKHPIEYSESDFTCTIKDLEGTPICVMNPKYLLKREQHLLETGESTHPRHKENVERLKKYLNSKV
ncbi:MAG: hypothetical protein AABX66_02515 [Nanoarchaeota archaeon]